MKFYEANLAYKSTSTNLKLHLVKKHLAKVKKRQSDKTTKANSLLQPDCLLE